MTKFNRGQLVRCPYEGGKLYAVVGYNAGGNIVLIPFGSVNKRETRVVRHSDVWLYEKKRGGE